MKTLYIVCNCYLPTGASTNRILAVVKGLNERNICVKMLFIYPDSQLSKVHGDYPNIEFIYLWGNGRGRKLSIILSSYIRLLKYLRNNNNIFTNYPKLMCLPLGLFNINLFHERTEHPDVVRNTKSYLSNILNRIYLYNCRKLKGLFVITNNLKEYFISQGVKSDRISVVNMVVDPDRFEGLGLIKQEDRYIAYCGTVSIGKDGVDCLIESFKIVADKIADVKLYIIGGFISAKDKDSIYRSVENYGLNDRIVFTGRVLPEKMPYVLKGAKALVLARSDNKQATYGFPTKLGEYLLTENPVVITRTGEINLFLEDMKSALIAVPNNIDSISQKIIWALENETEAMIIGKEGKEVALRSFNYKIEAEKIAKKIFGDN